MNHWLMAVAVLFSLWGGWVIPTTQREAKSPLAPYRALRGVIYLLIGLGCYLVAIGFKAAVVVAP